MLNKTVIATAVGAAVLLGGGGAALAATSPSGSSQAVAPTTASTGKAHHTGKDREKAFRGEYAQWTSYDAKTKTTVVHDGVRGTVSSVSPTSISIKTADGTVKTYTVTTSTKVHAKGDTKTTPGTISQVKPGDRAEVLGTGSTTFTATRIHDRGVATTK